MINVAAEKFAARADDISKIYDEIELINEHYALEKNLGDAICQGIVVIYYSIRQDFNAIITRFQEEYPNVEIKCFSYQPQKVFRALSEERIDIGVLPIRLQRKNGSGWKIFKKKLRYG